jgi:hypothetical protein
MKARVVWGALVLWGASQGALAETFRCPQVDGSISFRPNPCTVAELAVPEPSAHPVAPAAAVPAPVAAPVATPAPVRMPATAPSARPFVAQPQAPTVAVAPAGTDGDDVFIKPSKRKREVLDLSAQFERCRADMPGFAEKSALVYVAWRQRHAEVIAEYDKLLAAKVRAGRRGEMTLPLAQCNDDWLRAIEPLTRTPDPRFQTVEKTWQVFMGALMTGDRATALHCLGGKAQARWKQRVETMSDDDLRSIAATIRAMKVQWGDDYEKEGLVADTGNRVVGIAFRNVNEEWKITGLGGAPAVATPLQ